MDTRIRRDGDRVWIEGVVGWSFGERVSSIHAAQASAMEALGETVDYDSLVGVSGLAFRMQLSKQGFCPSSPHPACGFRCLERSSLSLPYRLRVLETTPDGGATEPEIREAVIESIDRGFPVVYGNEEDGLIVGYRKSGEEWLCLHPSREGGRRSFVETTLVWGIAVFTVRKDTVPSAGSLLRESLEQAVAMARAEEAGNYWLGFRAWSEYIGRLGALDAADESARRDAMLGNAWIYGCLVHHRRSASTYLREIAGEYDIDIAHQIVSLADIYSRIADQILTDADHRCTDIAPFPFMLKEIGTWSSSMRSEQGRRLATAVKAEREAIDSIERMIPAITSS